MTEHTNGRVGEERIEEIRRLRAGISPTPWNAHVDQVETRLGSIEMATVEVDRERTGERWIADVAMCGMPKKAADARFIAAAPQIVDDLLSDRDSLARRLSEVEGERDATQRAFEDEMAVSEAERQTVVDLLKEREASEAARALLERENVELKADMEFLESKLGLRTGVELLYVVDGYNVDLLRDDGNECYATQHAPTLTQAIRAHRAISSGESHGK